jgi:hypothetical protein
MQIKKINWYSPFPLCFHNRDGLISNNHNERPKMMLMTESIFVSCIIANHDLLLTDSYQDSHFISSTELVR